MTDTDTAVLLRRVRGVRADEAGVTLDIDALPGVQLGMMPGWLTGEPLEAQGVETQMPNLPDISLPPTDVTAYALRVTAPQPRCLRLVLAPAGNAALDDDGTGLGIVVDATPDPSTLDVEEHDDRASPAHAEKGGSARSHRAAAAHVPRFGQKPHEG